MELVRSVKSRIYNALCRLKWEAGQTTAEYALVLLAAAAVAVVLITWAKDNGTLKQFFTDVLNKLKQDAGIGGGGN